jgi:hypothetical protein
MVEKRTRTLRVSSETRDLAEEEEDKDYIDIPPGSRITKIEEEYYITMSSSVPYARGTAIYRGEYLEKDGNFYGFDRGQTYEDSMVKKPHEYLHKKRRFEAEAYTWSTFMEAGASNDVIEARVDGEIRVTYIENADRKSSDSKPEDKESKDDKQGSKDRETQPSDSPVDRTSLAVLAGLIGAAGVISWLV